MNLTKQAIKKLLSADIKVSLWNGCFNKAVVEAKFSHYRIEVIVEKGHPELAWMTNNELKNSETLTYWTGSSGSVHAIPEELAPLIEKMREAATIPDTEAKKLSNEAKIGFREFMVDMGMIPT